MRILFICDYLGLTNPSGAGRYVLETGRSLRARGHEVRILAGGEPSDPATDGKDGYPLITRFPFPASRNRARWLLGGGLGRITRAAVELAKAWPPTHLILNQPLSGDAVPDLGIPAAYVFHSPWGAEREGGLLGPLRNRIERRVLARCGRAVVLSDFMRGELTKIHHGLTLETEKIPGGADLARFSYTARPGGKRPTLLTVRRLVPRMGLETLIDAMALLRSRVPEALLIIAGRGPLEPVLRLKIAQLALEPQVRLAGFLPEADLPGALGAADLFVMPSERLEGFGMVIPEAMSCGTPVLGTPVGAIPEVLGAFDPSLVLPAVSPQAMADGMASLLAQPGRLAALRPACRAHAERHFGWDRAARQFETFLQGSP
jgi:glycosyltransferase involved in cell wall biosynthesis